MRELVLVVTLFEMLQHRARGFFRNQQFLVKLFEQVDHFVRGGRFQSKKLNAIWIVCRLWQKGFCIESSLRVCALALYDPDWNFTPLNLVHQVLRQWNLSEAVAASGNEASRNVPANPPRATSAACTPPNANTA